MWPGVWPNWKASPRGVAWQKMRCGLPRPPSSPSVLPLRLSVGLLSRRHGDIHQAIPALERSLALCQTANFPRIFPMAASFLSAAYALAGRAAEALPLLEQTLERVATGSRVIFHALVLTELSEALLLVGRVNEAQRTRRTPPRTLPHPYRTRLPGACLASPRRDRHACDPPDAEQAETYYRQALALAEELGMRPLQAHCHRGLGTLYATTGQHEQARAELSAAIELYRAMEMQFWLPQAETALAQVR